MVPEFRRDISRQREYLDCKLNLGECKPGSADDLRITTVEDKEGDSDCCDVMSRRRYIKQQPIISICVIFYK
jgi:hypothetical protein